MKKQTILPALLAAGALFVAGCGGDESSAGSASEGNGTDRAFATEMIPHHESAVEMAEIAQERGESEFVRGLADDIVRTQQAEISILRREDAKLADAGVKKGSLGVPQHMVGMGGDVEQLRTVEPFDDAFIKMMVPHHEGAIEMAKVERAKGSDPELKTLAQEISDAQQREIEAMKEHLTETTSDSGSGRQGPDEVGDALAGRQNSPRAAERRPARTTAQDAAAAGVGPRDLPVPTSE